MTYEERLSALGTRLRSPEYTPDIQTYCGDTPVCSCLLSETTCVLCDKVRPLMDGLLKTGENEFHSIRKCDLCDAQGLAWTVKVKNPQLG